MTYIEQEQHRQTVLCVDEKDIGMSSALPQEHLRNPCSPRAETKDFNRSLPPGTAASPMVTISPYPLILSLTISDTNSSNLGPNPTKSSGRCHSTDGLVTGASGKSRCFEYKLACRCIHESDSGPRLWKEWVDGRSLCSHNGVDPEAVDTSVEPEPNRFVVDRLSTFLVLPVLCEDRRGE